MQLHSVYKRSISNVFDVRLYYKIDEDDRVWWYFGFEKRLLKPFKSLLETTLYWGRKPAAEDDSFLIYASGALPTISTTLTKDDSRRLGGSLSYMIDQLNSCFNFLKRGLAK